MFVTTPECTKCGICIKECPTKAIMEVGDKVVSCITCGMCSDICPTKAIFMNKHGGFVVDKEKCTQCGLCKAICPMNIIRLEPYPVGICSRCGKCVDVCPENARVDGGAFLKYRKKELIDKLLDLAYIEKTAEEIKKDLEKEAGPKEALSKRSIKIDLEKCVLCGRCEWVCPPKAIELDIETEGCTQCGRCVEVCPFNAADPENYQMLKRCTKCLKCIPECPQKAIYVDKGEVKIRKPEGKVRGSITWCANCGICELHCPTKAIYKDRGKYLNDPSVCVRCEKCVEVCPMDIRGEKDGVFKGTCILCGKCIKECPHEAISFAKVSWDGSVTDACTKCGTCTLVCPTAAITLSPGEDIQVDMEKCILCETCAAYCPYDAIPILTSLPKRKVVEGITQVNKNACVNCMLCVKNCPHKAIDDDINVDPEKCIHCGACAQICPVNAIKVWREFDNGVELG